jgi:hypothetical protein
MKGFSQENKKCIELQLTFFAPPTKILEPSELLVFYGLFNQICTNFEPGSFSPQQFNWTFPNLPPEFTIIVLLRVNTFRSKKKYREHQLLFCSKYTQDT